MPTNLPPEYANAEQRYREAESIPEKITTLEELISTIPKHKGTDKLRAGYRRRLSKLKVSAQTQKRTGGFQSAFTIDKEGAGQAVIIGFTNVGKSALVAALTNASPEFSEVPFTTWKPTPGMMPVEDIQVQLVDTPSLDRDYFEPEMYEMIKRSDIILLVVDLQTFPVEQLKGTIEKLRENNIIPYQFKDHFEGLHDQGPGTAFIPLIVLANKCDDEACDEVFTLFCELLEDDWPLIPISAQTNRNLGELKQAVFDELDVIRVYSKAPGQEPDLGVPFVLKRGSTVTDLARKVHLDFYRNLKAARVWGSSAFDGQKVQRDFVLQDGDIVELRI
jgi:ribosome-interacting GTPase 1